MTYKTFTYDELYGLYTSAISREKEANRDWSTAAREWIGERDTLRAENEQLRTALSSLEWTGGRYGGYCDLCDRTQTEAHAEGCVMVGIDERVGDES